MASELQLERLINALLALASGEHAVGQREPVDLAAVTNTTLRARAREIEHRSLQVNVKLDPAATTGNRQLLERLVANVIDNAIAHNTTEGWIELASATRSGKAVLSATNTGAVIPRTDLERLKQPFQRPATDRTNHAQGHGLGLSIVHAIAGAHGGTMELYAGPEGGLRVQIEMPAEATPDATPIHTAAVRA